MAPYPTTLPRVIEKFAYTPKRREIFKGFIQYRQELSNLGIVDGFQWLSGSILENIENIEGRDPKDIDIVTFFHRPIGARDSITWMHFASLNRVFFSPHRNKTNYNCDTQYIELDSPTEDVVNLTRFWFGLFSHRRNDQWKGMLTIPLALSADDTAAAAMLAGPESPAPISTGGEAG